MNFFKKYLLSIFLLFICFICSAFKQEILSPTPGQEKILMALKLHSSIVSKNFYFNNDESVPTKIYDFINEINNMKQEEFISVINELKQLKFFSDSNSTNYIRLAPIYLLAKKIYTNHFINDSYTLLTDGESKDSKGHYLVVADLLERPANFVTVVAALFHDIERYFEKTKVPYFDRTPLKELKNKNLDSVFRKKVTHPENSARLTNFLLSYFNVNGKEKNYIMDLIRYHDADSKGVAINYSPEKEIILLPEMTDPSKVKDLNNLITADALAFFSDTFKYFIKNELIKLNKKGPFHRKIGLTNLEDRIVYSSFGKIASRKKQMLAYELGISQIKKMQSQKDNQDLETLSIMIEIMKKIKIKFMMDNNS